MNNRVKELRQYFDLSQEAFGLKLGVTRTAISLIESGKNKITNQMIKAICREFNIREEWLRYGEGEMIEELTKEEMVASLLGKVFTDNESDIYDFKLSVFRELGKLDNKDWEVIKRLIDGIKKE